TVHDGGPLRRAWTESWLQCRSDRVGHASGEGISAGDIETEVSPSTTFGRVARSERSGMLRASGGVDLAKKHMKRRQFITLLGGATAWPLSARAQQTGRLPTIGFLGAATAVVWGPWTAAFEKRLDELGWMKGRTVAIEYRWAEGRSIRFAEIATEFVRFNVDAIVTAGGQTTPPGQPGEYGGAAGVAPATDPARPRLVAAVGRPDARPRRLS